MILFLLAYLGGALTIVSPCILPVLPFVFARADRSFARGGLPLLVGMAATFAVVATLAAIGGGWAVEANQYGRIAALALLALFGVTLLFPALSDRMMRPVVAAGRALVPVCGAGRHERWIFDPALAPAWGRDGPALGSLRRPIIGLDPDRGRAPGSKHTNLAAAHRLCSRRGHFACARSPCRRADLCRDEAFARDRRMGTAGSGRRDSHCGRRDRIGSRHRLSHPRVPRKHGFARTRLARQIPFRGGHPTTAVRDHVRRPRDDDSQSRLDDEGQANGSSRRTPRSRASCLRCLARLHG